jgi:uncharacterized membrane protein YesL
MTAFFFKKSFFDGWDNLLPLAIVNAAFSSMIMGEIGFAWAMLGARNGVPVSIVEILMLVAGFTLICVYAGASAFFVNKMADFEKVGFRDFLDGLKKTAGKSALFAVLASVLAGILVTGFRYYSSTGGFFGLLAACLLFWFAVACALSLQFFFPVMVRLGGSFPRMIKKCFLIALDNPGFSLFQSLWSLALALVSLFALGFLPGPAGIQLALCDALRLRVYKYDYLDANPGANRRKIPWKELIAPDEELVGKRSLRGMIFPWKEDNR